VQPPRDQLVRLCSQLADEKILEGPGLGAVSRFVEGAKVSKAVGVPQELEEGRVLDL
jgi:hypothetical protein